MSDFSNYNFAPNDPCIIEGRLVQLWRPRVFVELHYITLHYITLFISTKIFTLGSVYICPSRFPGLGGQATCSKWRLRQLHGCRLRILGAERGRDLDKSIIK